MKLSRTGALAAVGLGVFALSAGCERREERALGTEREGPGEPAPQAPQGAPPGERREEPRAQPPPQAPGAEEPPQAPGAEEPPKAPGMPPAAQIAQARCELEQRCGRVGQGQRYESMDACLTAVRQDWQEDLNAYECPGGFNQGELSECLAEIRTEGCESAVQKLGSFVACRASDICESR